ncbi:MAG: prephenate dehydrogenase/arogenate dehydrogenase family protein [Ruminococcus sp.]|nr:prephenate dehydrogenase/arogenate dehydrogenase family protein [Ruminococcus sp.]
MKIAIVGLGLIGGSLARAIRKNTDHSICALDIDRETLTKAISQEVIDSAVTADDLNRFDLVILGLYPEETVKFCLENKDKFKTGGIVIDTCGVKQAIVSQVELPLKEAGVRFVGCHPMAGREYSGFEYSVDNLFEKASFIMTPTDDTAMSAVREISAFAYEIGFAKCVISSPEEHDSVIAFTSQLAHIVSSAYVKSPSLMKQAGFSAGSFRDLTRVAKLNEHMWTSLFLMNRDALLFEIDHIIDRLEEYRGALRDNDPQRLCDLLRQGRELKEKSNEAMT